MNVESLTSSGFRLPSLAFFAKSAVALDKPRKLNSSDRLITGTIRLLSGRATATPIFIF